MGTIPESSSLALLPASRARFGVLGFLCGLFFLLYLDRLCISKAAPHIQAELALSDTEMAVVFGAFTLAYVLFQVLVGRWGDRFGSRGVLTAIVVWWSTFTALTGCVWAFTLDSGLRVFGVPLLLNGFLLMLLVRFLFGIGEAGALPNAARIVARWFPPGKRGPAQGLLNMSSLIGGAVTPIAAAYLIQEYGWRSAFYLFGGLGVIWATTFYYWFRDDPAEHPAVNQAERQLIAAGDVSGPGGQAHPRVPWGLVLTSANVWLLGGVITCSAFVSYIYYTWYPTYLEKGRAVDPLLSGWLSGMVLAGGALGCTLGGFLADAIVRWTGSRRWGRRIVGAGALGTAGVWLTLGVQCDSAVVASIFTTLAALSAMLAQATWWSCVTDISGRHLGALFGLMNSLGGPGAIAGPLFFGYLADRMRDLGYEGRAQYDPGFYVYSGVLLLGAIGWLFVDSTKSAVEPAGERGRESPADEQERHQTSVQNLDDANEHFRQGNPPPIGGR
jgi:ACS family glucarate transporter-like MFS transporter